MPALSTGQSYSGIIKAAVGTCASAAGVDMFAFPVAAYTTLGITTRIVYQRPDNADSGYQVITSLVNRNDGASCTLATTATAQSVSWAAGDTTVTISGAYFKVHATAAFAAVFSAVSEIIVLKQPYVLA